MHFLCLKIFETELILRKISYLFIKYLTLTGISVKLYTSLKSYKLKNELFLKNLL